MELLEPDDLKMSLLKKSARHKSELEEEVKYISERSEKIITNTLIIGGTLAATYFLVRQFSGSKSKGKRKTKKSKIVSDSAIENEEEEVQESFIPGIVSQIGTALVSQASVLLLTLAKEKLSEYLEAQAEKKNKNSA
ncbi:MAG TPA: hypothetical protein PLJ60_08245 [Chryseolinea sp.]|nr:hypothetical protein [Chryseolinea sp.]HPH46454.1 hypothetical protein [Chryseolinea sp.]HPM30314.1 hypothetical protein [Chryseolinea sp.]